MQTCRAESDPTAFVRAFDDRCDMGHINDDLDWAHIADLIGGLVGLPCAPGPGDACDTDGERAVRLTDTAAWLSWGPCWRPDLADCL